MIAKLTLFLLLSVITFECVHEWERCVRVQLNSRDGVFYYWQWAHRKTSHGICATMYSGENGQLWVVEKPEDKQPTAIYQFNSRQEAEDFAESRCYSRDKEWKVDPR